MQISTSRFGEIEVEPRQLVVIGNGLYGFENVTQFCLLPAETAHGLANFAWLQAVDAAELAFVVVDPEHYFPGYAVEIADDDCDALSLHRPEEAALLAIVTIASNPLQSTANLLAPIVVNLRTRQGRQLILENSPYSTQHRLVDGNPQGEAGIADPDPKEGPEPAD